MKIFKVEAEGDTLYILAETKEQAYCELNEKIGKIPSSMLKWSEVKKLPKGEEFL